MRESYETFGGDNQGASFNEDEFPHQFNSL